MTRLTAVAALAVGAALLVGGCGKDEVKLVQIPDTAAGAKQLTLDPVAEVARAKEEMAAGDSNSAIARLWALVQEVPDHLDATVLLASAYVMSGRYREAVETTDAAILLKPDAPGVWMTRSTALAKLGKTDKAIHAIRKAIVMDPKNKAALTNLASFLATKKQWKERAEVMARLAALEPNEMGPHLALGRAWMRAGDLKKAEAALMAAIERVPGHGDAQLLLATVLYEQGRLSDAMDRADIAATIAPNDPLPLELFRAAFYVEAASKLRCRFGLSPWKPEQSKAVLDEYREQGMKFTEDFHEIHASYGSRPDVRKRVVAATVKRCPDKKIK